MKSATHVDNDINNWKTMGMSKAETVVLIAEDCIGWPYVYGERGTYDTPAKRRSRADALDGSMPAEAAVIRKGCQVLNGKAGSCSGCKYYPGGAKTRCFDCRGFTYWVLQQVGITINGAGATSQWNTDANWKAKGNISDMPAGQVCCVFMNKGSKMEHTGLHVGGGRIIHCSGEVKIGKTTDKDGRILPSRTEWRGMYR
jgi:cell wall-associated NlpC family hydrolase